MQNYNERKNSPFVYAVGAVDARPPPLRYSEIFSIVRDVARTFSLYLSLSRVHIREKTEQRRRRVSATRALVVDVNFLSGWLACIRASASLIRSVLFPRSSPAHRPTV